MRVEEFLPSGGRLLVVAQRKTGKTIFGLNLALPLIVGGRFLGRFEVRRVAGRVGMLNFEVTGRQLAWWAQQVGIPDDRLYLVNLRGRRNPFDHPDDRAALVELLRAHDVEVLIVDPFGRAYTGRSQNDAGEVTPWLADLDRFATDAGVAEVVLNVHAGWFGERSRGSSALEDWADSIVTLTRDPDDQSIRYLSAFGRDIDVDEDRLIFEPDTRTLTLAGSGSRQHGRTERAIEQATAAVLEFVADNPGCSGQNIRNGADGNDRIIDKARRQLVERGDLDEKPRSGRGGGKSYRLPPEPRPTPAEPRPTEVGTPATPVYRAGVLERGSEA